MFCFLRPASGDGCLCMFFYPDILYIMFSCMYAYGFGGQKASSERPFKALAAAVEGGWHHLEFRIGGSIPSMASGSGRVRRN